MLRGLSLLLLTATPLAAQTPTDGNKSTHQLLALHSAVARSKMYLQQDDTQKAVDVLEAQLSQVNGDLVYLAQLRNAYRAHIKMLVLSQKADESKKYQERLIILDPASANDPTLRTLDKYDPAKDPRSPSALPDFAAVHPRPPEIKAEWNKADFKTEVKSEPAQPELKGTFTKANDPPQPIFRAIREDPKDDPFDLSNKRNAKPRPGDSQLSGQFLAKAEDEFRNNRFSLAKQLYDQALQMDERTLQRCQSQYAYCLLDEVVQHLNKPGAAPKPYPELQKQVQTAMALDPTHLTVSGQGLLKEIDQRNRKQGVNTQAGDPTLNIQHFSKNQQGWMVSETTNFRIFHHQSRDLVEKVALISERTRQNMLRKWFGTDKVEWTPKCEVVLHATSSDYIRHTGVPSTTPGHARIESDPSSYRVVGRRIDLPVDNPNMLEMVLPHETTHVVLAGMFGNFQVPRWADEGIAVLSEPQEKIDQHRANMMRAQREGQLFTVAELMNLTDYPQPRRIGAFYAQSVVLVDYLTQQRGPQVMTNFLRDGLRDGYEAALRKHYGWSFTDLQTRWDTQVASEMNRAVAGR